MKSVFVLVFIASFSLWAESLQPLAASGSKYETYLVYETNVKQVSVLVDYEKTETDCHGLDYLYEAKEIATNRFIVSKKMLLKPLYLCGSTEFFSLKQNGIKIEIPITQNYSGTTAHAEVIVPTDSAVLIQLER